MRSPGAHGWLFLDEVASTQDVAATILAEDRPYGVVLARHQLQGRGRHGRVWHSASGDSLTMSMIFRGYEDWPSPHLIGMAVAIAAASTVHCQVQWPNDLVTGGRKLGGIITELKPGKSSQLVPVVGLGINLSQSSFAPELAERAISILIAFGHSCDAREMAERVLDSLVPLPEPRSWADISDAWSLFDKTPGKRFQLPSGEAGIAVGVGSGGEMICTVEGETRSVLAADAIFGSGRNSG